MFAGPFLLRGRMSTSGEIGSLGIAAVSPSPRSCAEKAAGRPYDGRILIAAVYRK